MILYLDLWFSLTNIHFKTDNNCIKNKKANSKADLLFIADKLCRH